MTVIVQPNKKTDSILQQTAKQLQKHKEEDAKKQLQSKAARQAKHQNESQVLSSTSERVTSSSSPSA